MKLKHDNAKKCQVARSKYPVTPWHQKVSVCHLCYRKLDFFNYILNLPTWIGVRPLVLKFIPYTFIFKEHWPPPPPPTWIGVRPVVLKIVSIALSFQWEINPSQMDRCEAFGTEIHSIHLHFQKTDAFPSTPRPPHTHISQLVRCRTSGNKSN